MAPSLHDPSYIWFKEHGEAFGLEGLGHLLIGCSKPDMAHGGKMDKDMVPGKEGVGDLLPFLIFTPYDKRDKRDKRGIRIIICGAFVPFVGFILKGRILKISPAHDHTPRSSGLTS